MPVIYGESGKDVDGNGHHMETQAWLDTDNGHMEAQTHSWCANWVFGFTGSVGLIFLGDGRRPLGHTQVEEYGVDARGVWWKRSSRTDMWSMDIDPAMARNVRELVLVHSAVNRVRLGEILQEAGGYAGTIEQWIQQNGALISEIGGML